MADRVAWDMAPRSSCLTLSETRVYLPVDEPGPPAMLVPESFDDPAVRRAAHSVARAWGKTPHGQPRVLPSDKVDWCEVGVGRPLYAGDYAFVSYHDPGGTIGAIAFRRIDGEWREVERTRLGYW